MFEHYVRRYWDREAQKYKYQKVCLNVGHPIIKGITALGDFEEEETKEVKERQDDKI